MKLVSLALVQIPSLALAKSLLLSESALYTVLSVRLVPHATKKEGGTTKTPQALSR